MPSSKRTCEICGSPNIFAKIEGKYYCFKCGSRLVLEHARKIVKQYRKTITKGKV